MTIYTSQQIGIAMTRFFELTTTATAGPTEISLGFWQWLNVDWHDAMIPDPNMVGAGSVFTLPEANARYVDLLLSPHYHTLYKAWQIQQEGNDAKPTNANR